MLSFFDNLEKDECFRIMAQGRSGRGLQARSRDYIKGGKQDEYIINVIDHVGSSCVREWGTET